MARRGRRRRLERGIFLDRTGYAVVVRVRGVVKERRFPIETTREQLKLERDALQGWLLTSLPATPTRGTLDADIRRVLTLTEQGRSRGTRASALKAWAAVFGSKRRYAITAPEIRQVLTEWLDAGVSPSTVNKRLGALRALYRDLATSPHDPNPARQVSKVQEDAPEIRAVPRVFLGLVIGAMPDRGVAAKGKPRSTVNLSKLRLRVMHWTGLPPATLARVRLEDLDLTSRPPLLYMRPRRKGKGAKGAWVELLPEAAYAFRQLVAAGGLGSFSQQALNHAFQRTCATIRTLQAKATVSIRDRLPHLTPYQARHSFLSWLAEASQDERAVQELAQHADIRTTRRYTERSVSPRVSAALAAARKTRVEHETEVGTSEKRSS